jgi:hypothetical protein
MLGQQEAKAISRTEVGPEHVLIGLIAEESSKKGGYLGFGASIDLAREKAALLTGARRNGEHEKPDGAYAVSPVERGGTRETPFSLGAKVRNFPNHHIKTTDYSPYLTVFYGRNSYHRALW